MNPTDLPLRLTATALALVAVTGLWNMASNAPALSTDLRDDGLFGDWRTVRPASLYHRGDYAYEVGFTYMQADLMFADATEPQGQLADAMTSADRAATAKTHLRQAVEVAPTSARAWTALAWAHAISGDLETAEEAVRTSWAIAPHNTYLATQRLPLFALLREEGDPNDMAAFAQQDAEDLMRFRPRFFRIAFSDQPAIAGLLSSD